MYVAWTQDQKDEGSALPPEPSWTCASGLCGADGAASVCGGDSGMGSGFGFSFSALLGIRVLRVLCVSAVSLN